ncbi:MAG: peptide chain release factor family protein [Planctomycetaceae bacterium]
MTMPNSPTSHSSAAESHPVRQSDEQLQRDCTVERIRRSGPGGQHRNKVETGIRLLHKPTGLTAQATERRSQAENLQAATERLRWELVLSVRRPIELTTGPSPLWLTRCKNERIIVSESHHDFPLLAAEALDALVHFQWDMKGAADFLSCSSSQLTKLLQKEPHLMTFVNTQRNSLGLRTLH